MSMFARTSDPNPDSERHTEKTASLSLDFRAKDLARPIICCKLLKFMYPLPCTHPWSHAALNPPPPPPPLMSLCFTVLLCNAGMRSIYGLKRLYYILKP